MGTHLGYKYEHDELKKETNKQLKTIKFFLDLDEYLDVEIYNLWRRKNEQLYSITKLMTLFSKIYAEFNKIYEVGECIVNSHNSKLINELYLKFIDRINSDIGYFNYLEYNNWKEKAQDCVTKGKQNIDYKKYKSYKENVNKLEALVKESECKRKEYNSKYIYLIENTKKAIIELKKNEYINKLSFRQWQEKYKYTFSKLHTVDEAFTNMSDFESIKKFLTIYNSYEKIELYNKKYIDKEKKECKHFFDNINGVSLDQNQREVIIKDEINHLVVAGAGCGKTTLICAKVMYLIKRHNISPKDILLISYSNKAVDEMKKRLTRHENLENIEVSTMHKLGKNIISRIKNKEFSVVDSKDMSNIIKEKFNYYINNNVEFKDKIVEFYLKYYYSINDKGFKNEDEYLKYLRYSGKIKTINGEIVRSFEELEIANFLYRNGIKYKYEQTYKYDKNYNPDFYLPEYDIYIEHFGVDKNKQAPYFFNNRNEYTKNMEEKIKKHKSYGTNLIETYSWMKKKGILLKKLEDDLKSYNVRFNKLTNDQIIRKIKETIRYSNLLNLLCTVISHVKCNQNNYTILKRKYLQNKNLISYTNCRENLFIEIFDFIYREYQNELKKNSNIDFGDMINLATNYIKQGKYKNNYKYIIIDEIQDISNATYEMIKALVENNKNCRLFCVGDDWQSIYRFSGSDVNLFYDFENLFKDVYISHIINTYRFDKELVEISNKFIMIDKSNMYKKVISNKRYYLGEQCKIITDIMKTLDEISKKEDGGRVSVYILGRYENDKDKLKVKNNKAIYVKANNCVLYDKNPNLDIKFLTVHKSKGMEADYVIILNCEESNKKNNMKGFPTNIQDDPILDIILPRLNKDEDPLNQNSEERRLFYVAMTRAKKQVFLYTAKEKNKSIYVEEIKQIKEKII